MNKVIPNGPSLSTIISCLLLSAGLFAGQQAAAKEDKTSFKVAVISDASAGRKVLKGNYEQAISTLAAKEADVFSVSTNLCVAYLMEQQIAKANQACENAVAISREQIETGSVFSKVIAERRLAVSLSNLGVLKALAGDVEAARSNFNQASALNTRLSHPQVNLSHLERRTTVDA